MADIDPRLKHIQKELDAAAGNRDHKEFRRLIESAGLTWLDPELPEKYKSDSRC